MNKKVFYSKGQQKRVKMPNEEKRNFSQFSTITLGGVSLGSLTRGGDSSVFSVGGGGGGVCGSVLQTLTRFQTKICYTLFFCYKNV